MAAPFRVHMTLPDRAVYEGEAESLVVPAELGYLGVLAHHAPIIARLIPGKITLRDISGKIKSFVLNGSGFIEFSGNSATLMLDSLVSA